MKLEYNSKIQSEKYLLPDGRLIVRFEVLAKGFPEEEANRNVFLLDEHGNVVWRIAGHESINESDPFVGISISENGLITGHTWDGWRYEIEIRDGSIKKTGWTKS